MFRRARKKTGAQTTFSILEETKCSTAFWLLHQDLPRPWMWSAFYSVLVHGSMSVYMMELCNDAGLHGNPTEVTTDRVVSFTPLLVPDSWKSKFQIHLVKSKSQVSFIGIYVQSLKKTEWVLTTLFFLFLIFLFYFILLLNLSGIIYLV